MADSPKGNVVFLPWVRQGAAAAIDTADTLDDNLRGAVDLTATLTINGTPPMPVPVRLRGPADVVGIDPREIVRMDPRPNTADFEPNYLAAIEFDRPDFPWLFTPARAGASGRLRPWLCLVVVRAQDGVVVRSTPDAPLAVLDIAAPARPADELPDLDDSWAWAHAQVASGGNAGGAELRAALSGPVDRSLSRLICPRLLQPNTDYVACVVPTFELGRRAGLGENILEGEITHPAALKPAWSLTPPPGRVTLPAYHQWRFRTGEAGDFESLVQLLRARPAPESLGKRPMDVSRPGFALPGSFPEPTVLGLEGALRPVGDATLAPWPEGTAEPFQAALAQIVNAPGEAATLDPEAEPLLAPPLYGRWHAARTTVARGATSWFDELNLDPRHRAVAAFGARVVQEHQEALMAAAWEQAADLERANRRLRQLQLSLAVGASLHARHFLRMSEDQALRVSAPALARIRATAADAAQAKTFAARLAESALPLQATSPAMRRIGRERGPITRRVAAQGGARAGASSWVAKLNLESAVFMTVPPAPDHATFDAMRDRLPQPLMLSFFGAVTAEVVADMRGRPTFEIAPEGQPVNVPGLPDLPPSADSPAARDFRLAASAHLQRIDPGRVGIVFGPPPALALRELRDALMTRIEPRRTLVPLANAIVATGANASTPTNATTVPIDTVVAAPKFGRPMYEPLRDLSQQLLLPGLEAVLPNSVLGLATNRRFLEAYMAGLNFEMGRELLWRGFPTDQRGTYFEQFWDASGSPNGRPDVTPLHAWGATALGQNQSSDLPDQFVMLMRSDLLRRYPTAVIYATRARAVDSVRTPSADPADEVHPAFRGSMEPDVSFFGFDLTVHQVTGDRRHAGYFIVIQEQPTEPRFGLDAGTSTSNGTHLKVSGGPPAGLALDGLEWGRNAAHMAGILRQQPVRVAIHASQLLKR